MNYQEYDVLPPYDMAKAGSPKDEAGWSGELPPPAIGATVTVKTNKLGDAVVKRYFVKHGWLGLIVSLNDPPDWFVKQNKGNPDCHVFGAELQY